MKIADVQRASPLSISRFLETAPRDELYSALELYQMFKVAERTIRDSKVLKEYGIEYEGRRYWGSPAAIQEFQRQVNG